MGLTAGSGFDAAYVEARRVLLDALEALVNHRQAIIVVGAQAVYLRTGPSSATGIAPFTTDADIAIDPRILAEKPALEQVLGDAGFTRDSSRVGTWSMHVVGGGTEFDVDVDLLVPEEVLTTPGRRDARLRGHAERSARRVAGLEAALVDHDFLAITSLDREDRRSVTVRVAGSAALLIAKLHKVAERLAEPARPSQRRSRVNDKDAADIYRLFQAISVASMAARFQLAAQSQVSEASAARARDHLVNLFGRRGAAGIEMAVRSLRGAIPPDTILEVSRRYVAELLDRMSRRTSNG
jgi:hypothetical protein